MKFRLRLIILALCFSSQLFSQLTIKVTSIPDNTPANASLYVAGSFQGWNPGDPNSTLTNNGNGTYQITVTPPAGVIKYKFTRGSWATVEGNAAGGFRPDREYNYSGAPSTLEVEILGWEDLGDSGGGGNNSTAADNVFVLNDNFSIPQLDRTRRVWMYLPPDYENSGKFYPVLYMHDGQNLFDAETSFSGEWKVDESLNTLFSQGDYGCIVVGIDNGGQYRIDEYAPWANSSYNAGGQGGEYLDFIVETLKPYIDTNYRTLSGRNYTGIMGSSLGALISHYGLIERQDVFGKAGIFSPAYWFNPDIFKHTDNTPKTQDLKIYTIAGQTEGNGSVVNDVDQMNSLLLGNGFASYEVKKLVHSDGQHSEWYWAREFPAAYQWLFAGLDLNAASEEAPDQIRVFPNPTDSVLHLANVGDLKKPSFKIYSLEGKLVQKGKLDPAEIFVENLNPGAYILQVYSKRSLVFKEKIIKN